MEQRIEIERMEQAVNLFGSFDENIRLIESEFHVAVTNREGELRISGEAEDTMLAAKAVNALASLGIITGYEDGSFRPEDSITRAEFAAMALRFAEESDSYVNSFPDVPATAWYCGAVAGAAHYGWLNGYPDGTFRPSASITRAEAATAMNRVLGRVCDKNYVNLHADELLAFSDLAPAHWAYYDIAEAANGHDYVRAPAETWTALR